MASKHGGDIFSLAAKLGVEPEDILDLSSNVVERHPMDTHFLSRLPPEEPFKLEAEIERFFGLETGTVLVNAGSSQLIKDICLAYRGSRALIFSPTYTEYERFAKVCEMRVEHVLAEEKTGFRFELDRVKFDGFDVVFICNPNNPTGSVIGKDRLFSVIKENRETLFVLDESYMDFDFNQNTLLGENFKNLCVIRSFSKLYGLAAFRVGWLYSPNRRLIERVGSFRVPWSLTEAAISKARESLGFDFKEIAERIVSLRDALILELSKFRQIKTYSSRTNFVLFKLLEGEPLKFLSYFEQSGILIRNCADFYGLDETFFRVSVRSSQACKIFLNTLKAFFSSKDDKNLGRL